MTPITYTEFINEVNIQIDYQLGIKGGNTSNIIQNESSEVQN
jgi:hypothetical protein